jgi:hypothetical protein
LVLAVDVTGKVERIETRGPETHFMEVLSFSTTKYAVAKYDMQGR